MPMYLEHRTNILPRLAQRWGKPFSNHSIKGENMTRELPRVILIRNGVEIDITSVPQFREFRDRIRKSVLVWADANTKIYDNPKGENAIRLTIPEPWIMWEPTELLK